MNNAMIHKLQKTDTKPIILCEPIRWGIEHVPYNTALLKACFIGWKDRKIFFFAEPTHLEQIQQSSGCKNTRLEYSKLSIPPRHCVPLKRAFQDFRLVNAILSAASNCSATVIFSSINSTLLFAIRSFLGRNRSWFQISVILHSLAHLQQPLSINPIEAGFHIRTAFKLLKQDPRFRIIALEPGICDEIKRRFPQVKNSLSLVEHPIPLDTGTNFRLPRKGPLRFGFLGLATYQKGLFQFLKTAIEIKRRYPNSGEFHLVGRLHQCYKSDQITGLDALNTGPADKPMIRNEYIARLKSLDYVCLFFEGNNYLLSPSGVLLDCIAYEIPIISRRIPLVENLMNNYGEIGYLCEPGQYSNTIATILKSRDQEAYRRQIENLRKIKEIRSPTAMAHKLKSIHQSL